MSSQLGLFALKLFTQQIINSFYKSISSRDNQPKLKKNTLKIYTLFLIFLANK